MRRRLAATLIPVLVLVAGGACAPAQAQTHPEMVRVSVLGGPNWSELTPEQREALAPLAPVWNKFDANRKRKWLRIAARYRKLSPEDKERMHARMPQLAGLTPEQRAIARRNLERAYSLPAERRQALTSGFQNLPDARKRQLAEWSRKRRKLPPPRPGAGTHRPIKPDPDEVEPARFSW